jgi:PAS domain S-box-containing protein
MTGLRGKLLIVDDNAANLRAFTAILEPLGAEIMSVTSGEEALRVLLREELALILLDVQMPGMDGYETAGLIRARERSRHIPIIFLTALPRDDRFVARGYELGAVDFIVKPVDAQILRSKAQVFLELHEKTQIIRQQTEQLRRASEQKLIDYQRWSEQRYVSLADAMPELVWTADADGTLLFKNRHWALCAGSESTNLDFSDIVHPDDMPTLSAAVQAARAEGRDWELEARFGNPGTGEYRWHLARAVPTRGPDGEVTGWVGSSRDIDARRRAKHALEMLAQLSRRLAELSQGLSGLDQVLQLALPILGDAALLEVRGPGGTAERIASALPGMSVPELGDPRLDFGPSTVVFTGEPEVILDVERELAEPSKRSSDHARFLSEIGVASYVCVPLVVRERVLGAVAFFTAGSRRHYAETELRLIEDVAGRLATGIDNLQLYAMAERERKKLEEAGKAKDVFLATLSHELRTPLNAIVGWSHLLRGGLEPAQSARAIETIDRNARSLAKLVGDLIDVSRIVSGNLKVEERLIDFRQVVEAAVDALRPSADSGGIALELALETERAARVVGDATRLQQVTSNILANAIKFTPKGGTIQVTLETQNDLLTLSVKDTGHGIATEFLPFVFEPFRQGRRTHARSQEGLGLGLAIVKHLVELHGGSVRAESEGTGHGTTIVVALPLAAAPSSIDSRDAGGISVSPSEPPPPQTDQEALLSGVHALVVEDDPDGCELLETVLKSFGAKVTTAGTARDAYTALCAERPDVLVSDIGLPDEDGLALIRRVRETEGFAGLPAVALTAYASKRDVAQALAAGFQAHVAKPVAPQELGTTIARVSGR